MEKKVMVKNYDRVLFNGINTNPVKSSNRMSEVKSCFDQFSVFAKELPIVYDKDENLKNNEKEIDDKKGAREYYVFESNESHDMWQGKHYDERYFNECAQGKDQVRLVLDYDIKKSETTLFKWNEESDTDALNVIETIVDKICSVINPGEELRSLICTSSREDKISYHIIFPDVSIQFNLIPHFIRNVIGKFEYDEGDMEYVFKPNSLGEVSDQTWFDLNIYPTFDETIKSLRLVGHSKRCNNITLYRVKGNVNSPTEYYIKHRSELEFQIKELGDSLYLGSREICEITRDKKKESNSPTLNNFKHSTIDRDQLTEVLTHLDEGRRKYEYRIHVMFALYNTFGDDGHDLYELFLKHGEKDRTLKGRTEWSSIKDKKLESKCSLGTIFYYLKEDDIDFFNEIRKKIRGDPIKLFHDIGYSNITYDTLYDEIATRIYVKDDENDINELSEVYYMIKACISMFKTPDVYYRLKRVQRFSTGDEVIYQNTRKLDVHLTVKVENWTRKKGERVSVIQKHHVSELIGNGVKVGIMHNFITFYPSTEPTKDLNTFTGFVGSIKNDNADIDMTDIENHIKNVMCKNNPDIYAYFMNWLTHVVQKPWKKTEVVPILIGEQGVGKSILFENLIVPYVIGIRYCKTIDNIQILKDKHFSLSETLLLRFEEALFAGDKEAASMLKQKITGKTHMLNEKFQPIREVESFLNMVIISNNEHCISIDVGDRRYLMLECDNVHKGNTKYFNNLSKYFNPEGGRAFYNYLMNRKLDFITLPPITELKEKVIEMSKDKITIFMDEVKVGRIEDVRTTDVGKISHYMFTAEDLLRRIGDCYLTKPKIKAILTKNGWKYQKVYVEEFDKKGQYWRYLYPIPSDANHYAGTQD